MQLELEKETEQIKSAENDVFVILLIPSAGESQAQIRRILGKTVEQWAESVAGNFDYRRVPVTAKDDIASIVRKYAGSHKYTVVLYSDTPLLTVQGIFDAVNFAGAFGHSTVRLPRGWVFETSNIIGGVRPSPVDFEGVMQEEWIPVYSVTQENYARKILQSRIVAKHEQEGAIFEHSESAHIDATVQIEEGVIIEPNVIIRGNTVIKKGATIGSNTKIIDAVIGMNAVIESSKLQDCEIGNRTSVGPNANIRKGTKIGKDCKVGNFVEIKSSVLDDGTKVSHLAYVGDAEIGKRCNIGAGTIFCNYDGVKKNKTIVGDNVFVGSNTSLIAPLHIGENATIAAGSTITKDVPAGALGIARGRQENKLDHRAGKEVIKKTEPEPEPEVEIEIEEIKPESEDVSINLAVEDESESLISKQVRSVRTTTIVEVEEAVIEKTAEQATKVEPKPEEVVKEEILEEVVEEESPEEEVVFEEELSLGSEDDEDDEEELETQAEVTSYYEQFEDEDEDEEDAEEKYKSASDEPFDWDNPDGVEELYKGRD